MKRTSTLYAETPPGIREKHDCGVRALRVAAGLSYEEAHKLLRAHGRYDRHGTYNPTMRIVARILGFEIETPGLSDGMYGVHGVFDRADRPTLAAFIRAHPAGRWIIRINRHFIAVVDGTLHDWANRATSGPRSRVLCAWGRP